MISDFALINLNALLVTIEVCITTVTTSTIDVSGINWNIVVDHTALMPTNESEPSVILYQINALFHICEHEHLSFIQLKHV